MGLEGLVSSGTGSIPVYVSNGKVVSFVQILHSSYLLDTVLGPGDKAVTKRRQKSILVVPRFWSEWA